MRYLLSRGLTEKTIADFRIGYAPDSWDSLYTHLTRKGFKDGEIEKAGLIIKKQESRSKNQDANMIHASEFVPRNYYDRYRNRIIFPIADASGRTIAFGGRIFEEVPTREAVGTPTSDKNNSSVGAKYINSPETPLYNKSRVLYAFHLAKNAIREKNECIAVEGYMDCVLAHQAGITNTLAVSGTALTVDQLRIITRLANSVIFAFDMDSAGQSATKRSLELSAKFSIERKILILPSGKDPADAVRENPAIFVSAVSAARPVMDYYFEEAGKRYDIKSPQGKKNSALFFLPHIRGLANEIERSHWIQKFAELIGVPENAILTELDKLRPQEASMVGTEGEGKKARTRRELLEERLLCLYLEDSKTFVDTEQQLAETIPFAVLAHERFMNELREKGTIVSPELKALWERLQFERETLGYGTLKISEEIALTAHAILKEHYKEKMQDLHTEIKSLEKSENQDRIKRLLKRFGEAADKVKRYSA